MQTKVCILYFGSLKGLTGISTFIRSVSSGIRETPGMHLEIYSRDSGEDSVLAPRQANQVTRSEKKGLKSKIHRLFKTLSGNSTLFSHLYAYVAYNRNARIIVAAHGREAVKNDIVFFQDLFTACYFEKKYPANKYPGNKRVIVLHSDGNPMGMLFGYFPRLQGSRYSNRYFTRIAEIAINSAAALVFLSNRAKDTFAGLYPQFTDKLHVVKNGVPDRIPIPNIPPKREGTEKYRLVIVGTVVERKGHDILLRAIEMLPEEAQQRISLQVVGNGSFLPAMEELAAQIPYAEIHFAGAQSDVSEYLKHADIFILPSRDEGMPIAIIEAFQFGLPVISTNVGGIPELLEDGKNGILIAPDATELSTVLLQLTKGKYDLASLSRNAREHYVENFRSEVMVRKYCDLFQQTLNRR